MSIKPVDFQVMIPRTMEAAKLSNDMTQRNLAAQQQQATAIRHKAEDSLKQVYSRTQAQNARINEKQKDNQKKEGKGKKTGDKADNKAYENEGKGLGKLKNDANSSIIDIKI